MSSPHDHSSHTHSAKVVSDAATSAVNTSSSNLADFFSQSGFMPHGHCYLWNPTLVWTHVISDLLIGIAYLSIAISLYFLVRKIRLPFSTMVLSFGLFIGACGGTHFMEIWNLWNADYWAGGWMKVITAIASVSTGIWLVRIRPQILNLADAAKVADQRRIDLEALASNLEARVAERTHDLELSRREAQSRAEELRILTDALPSLVSRLDRDFRYRFANTSYVTWFNLEPGQVEGKHITEVIGDQAFNVIRSRLESVFLSGEICKFEGEMPYRTGGTRYVHATYAPIKDSTGIVESIIILVTDMSVERRAVEALQRSETEYRTIFELAGTGTEELDAQTGRFLRINRRFCEITGYEKAELLKMTFLDLTVPEDRDEEWRVYQAVRDGRSSEWKIEKRIARKDGQKRWVLVTGTIVRDAQNRAVKSIATIQDIEERKQSEFYLAEAKLRAEEASRAKSEFLANMSHEIRTPLGAMLGFAQLALEDSHASDEQRSNLKTILRNGEQLYRIINEILDISKVEANRLEVEKVRFHLNEVMEDITALLSFRANEKGLKMSVKAEGPVPDMVISDPTRLRQILINIIGNAVKFTDRGGVDVSYRVENDILKINVEDTGPGIPLAKQDRVFEPFMQADSSMTRRFGGTGLGLYLAKKLAQALGGDVSLTHCKESEGCHFLIEIPVVDVSPEGQSTLQPKFVDVRSELLKAPEGRIDGIEVLLVDDSPDNLVMTERFLKASGANVETSLSAKEGFARMEEKDFAVILMDIQMPEIDGYEAVRRLRAKGYKKPIVALTAHAMKGEREKCMAAGFDSYLIKPINRSRLISTVRTQASTDSAKS